MTNYLKKLAPALLILGPVVVAMWQAKSPNSYHLAVAAVGAAWAILNGAITDPGVTSASGGTTGPKS